MLELSNGEDAFQDLPTREGAVKCSYKTGPAGTGKTYQFRARIEQDETEGILCATTGVAAVNLGTTTLNSVLGYYDNESLADNVVSGKLVRRLIDLRKRYGYRSLMIDEASMLGAYPLGIITNEVRKANSRMDEDKGLSIELTGDFAQLPPVNDEWAFKSGVWPKYAENVTRLTQIYRQTDLPFLEALGLARRGEGEKAAEALRDLVRWSSAVDLNFDGTTIVDKNSKVDDINQLRYLKLKGREQVFQSHRWGKQKGEWKQIPPVLNLKDGAYVMILNNGYREGGYGLDVNGKRELIYANGDSGEVVSLSQAGAVVRLKRNGMEVVVPFLTRSFESKDAPDKYDSDKSYFDEARKRWILGQVSYLPIRLAYAVTVHKSQGLTLDSVQLDPRGHFFGSPGMAYVALSRAKTPGGIKIVGTPEMFKRRINADKEIGEWL